LVVIDLSHVYNGPYATLLMGLAGATVVKVEPRHGEHLRSRGETGGADLPFAMLNSNKSAVTLNLKEPDGRELLLRLVEKADVLVENFAPGVAERLGIGPTEVFQANPRIVYGRSSGFGSDGPYSHYPAMDLVMQAMCGVMDSTGFPDQPPVKAGGAFCDFSAGIHLYAAVVTALFERERTGRGRVVEVAMQDAVYSSLASNLGMVHAAGDSAPPRTGNHHGGLGVAPYNAYAATDGYVVVNAPGDRHFVAILDAMGRSDLAEDPRFMSRSARVQNMAEVDSLLESWTSTLTKAEIASQLLRRGVPCAPVRGLAEVIQDENMHARGSLQRIDHPELGEVVLPHSPLRFVGLPRTPIRPSRPLGSDNRAVFGDWLGLSDVELESFRERGVI
jgi:formyl-CoA transferase